MVGPHVWVLAYPIWVPTVLLFLKSNVVLHNDFWELQTLIQEKSILMNLYT